jgi:hypothetical protein
MCVCVCVCVCAGMGVIRKGVCKNYVCWGCARSMDVVGCARMGVGGVQEWGLGGVCKNGG